MINYDHFNLLMYNIISGHNQLRLSKMFSIQLNMSIQASSLYENHVREGLKCRSYMINLLKCFLQLAVKLLISIS